MQTNPVSPARGLVVGRQRRYAAWALLLVALPLMTFVLQEWRTAISLESTLLLYLTLVVVISALGGLVPGLLAAVAADLLVNYFLIPPYGTLLIESRDHLVAILVFIAVAAVVSVLVELASRNREAAARSEAEAALLSRLADAPVGEISVEAVLDDIRTGFGFTQVQLQKYQGALGWQTVATVGSATPDDDERAVDVDHASRLITSGPERFGPDQHMLRRLAAAAVRAQEEQVLAEQAEESRRLADLDRTRSALLAAVGHDLRTPLSGVKAAVSSLRQEDVNWSETEQQELLATIEESADRLNEVVNNLLDATRIQAGAVVADLQPTDLEAVVYSAAQGLSHDGVRIEIPSGLPWVLIDPGLFDRVLVNLLDNATRYRPPGTNVTVRASAQDAYVQLDIVDHGPGLAIKDPARVFDPFQRSDDRTAGGTGLGLAIVKGFCDAMDVGVTPLETDGGGLTMRLLIRPVR
jgi:K+-sensing histidine kinase KdpD